MYFVKDSECIIYDSNGETRHKEFTNQDLLYHSVNIVFSHGDKIGGQLTTLKFVRVYCDFTFSLISSVCKIKERFSLL